MEYFELSKTFNFPPATPTTLVYYFSTVLLLALIFSPIIIFIASKRMDYCLIDYVGNGLSVTHHPDL